MTALSPPITPTKYDRTKDGSVKESTGVGYEWDGVNPQYFDVEPRLVRLKDDLFLYYGELGEVYFDYDTIHVGDTAYRVNQLVALREYCLTVLSRLQEKNIITGLRPKQEEPQ